ncbi:MAG: ATP-binding cassette domain-containing protein [Acidimicrobiia bacterium]|nr:ATP-binding cassette domain-containing protein [Acidimicrobiia bacterium]
MATVDVDNLSKTFKVPVREEGFVNSMKALFHREYRQVEAVKEVSFSLDAGEVVGFLGPNGAGKTTTLKMLSGLLFPTGGRAEVIGFQPSDRDPDFLTRVALIMGNRNSLMWDLPVADSLDVRKVMYSIPDGDYRLRRERFTELLDVADLLTKPVRNLSLGERMKVEILAALLPAPRVLFLDEPTLGLDLSMQKRIRGFVSEYAAEEGATILLTSHYMADVTALCERVIVIHQGRLLFDGDLAELSERFGGIKTITVSVTGDLPDLGPYGTLTEHTAGKGVLAVPRTDVAAVASRLLADLDVLDLSIEDPPIEDVIERTFASGDDVERESDEATTE